MKLTTMKMASFICFMQLKNHSDSQSTCLTSNEKKQGNPLHKHIMLLSYDAGGFTLIREFFKIQRLGLFSKPLAYKCTFEISDKHAGP